MLRPRRASGSRSGGPRANPGLLRGVDAGTIGTLPTLFPQRPGAEPLLALQSHIPAAFSAAQDRCKTGLGLGARRRPVPAPTVPTTARGGETTMTDARPNTESPAESHPSTAAIAGHPLHPMLVPVPIGTLTAATVADVMWARTNDPFWARASAWLLGGSIVSGLAAAPLGLADFVTIPAARRRPEAWMHAVGNV